MVSTKLIVLSLLALAATAYAAVESDKFFESEVLSETILEDSFEEVESFNTTTRNDFSIGFMHPGSTLLFS